MAGVGRLGAAIVYVFRAHHPHRYAFTYYSTLGNAAASRLDCFFVPLPFKPLRFKVFCRDCSQAVCPVTLGPAGYLGALFAYALDPSLSRVITLDGPPARSAPLACSPTAAAASL
jgi:hypothetical protein